MGRQGPLTAYALGRSPYDEVVQGEGGSDPRDEKQLYDEKGRPVNPETKRLNREIVRSHNEVMHVIGVAEPDPSSNEAEVLAARRYMLYEQDVGDRMGRLGDVLMEVGVWGVWGLRRRVMIYKPFSTRPFWQLARTCREEIQRPLTGLFLAGLPTQVVWKTLDWLKHDFLGRVSLPGPLWIVEECISAYVHTHLAAYIFFQRAGILPGFRLPSPSFFLPFTSSSPVPAPEPPADFTLSSILTWCGAAVLNAGPILLLVLWRKYYSRLVAKLGLSIFLRLPKIDLIMEPRTTDTPDPTGLFLSSNQPTPGATTADVTPTQQADHPGEDSQQSSQPPTGGAPSRRPSAFSGRADDYGSEEEDNGAISGTLISFDVEATESSDAAPQGAQGIWSAELRPTTGTDPRSPGQPALYLLNSLTKQPLVHAAKVLSRLATCLMLAPLEAVAYRSLARSYILRRGGSAAHVLAPRFLGSLSWGWAVNLLAVEFVHFSLQSDIWAGVTILGRSFHMTPAEWSEMSPEEHAEFVQGIE